MNEEYDFRWGEVLWRKTRQCTGEWWEMQNDYKFYNHRSFYWKKNYICAKNSVTTRKQRKLGQRTSGMENSRCKGPEVGAHLQCRRREYQCDCNTVSKGHGDWDGVRGARSQRAGLDVKGSNVDFIPRAMESQGECLSREVMIFELQF